MVLVRFLRDSWVVARFWSDFKARGLNIIIKLFEMKTNLIIIK